jgi:hypothetical protein
VLALVLVMMPKEATATATATATGALGALKVESATDLLAGRLRVRLPKGARLEARGHSLMAAPESAQHETRVVIDAVSGAVAGAGAALKRERLVVMSYELFATAGQDLLAAVRKDLGDDQPQPAIEAMSVAGPELRAVAVTPASLDKTREAIPVLGVYVAQADGTVQYLDFYNNPPAAEDAAGATALARRIAATLAPGPRRLALTAGSRALSDGLKLQVPAGYALTRQDGPDFSVHHVRKLVQLGQPAPRLGVYVGGHPSFQYRQVERDTARPPDVKRVPGRLLGRDIEWHRWTRGEKPPLSVTQEAILPLSEGERWLVAHVFFTAEQDADLAELEKIAASLTGKTAPPPPAP